MRVAAHLATFAIHFDYESGCKLLILSWLAALDDFRNWMVTAA
jgi:hypothetical protein